MRRDRPRGDVLLFLLAAVPALAVAWGREDGHLAFVLYREPKLVAVAVLGWLFVSVSLWRDRVGLSLSWLQETVRRPPVAALAALLAYLTATGLWVRVPENFFYEINQYLLLLPLLLVLLSRQERDGTAARQVRYGLISSLAVVTALGALQFVVPLRFLTPINPEIGAVHPSLMGYKNPAALAVLGQLFLVAELVSGDSEKRFSKRRIAWGALLLAEVAYLVSLRSRTAYAAFAAGAVFLVVLGLARRPSRSRILGTAVAAAAVVSIAATVLAAYEPARERARSLAGHLAHPTRYLESDRGTYLLNTLNMARHHPWGVGLGDWQTHYPVFRLHHRDVSFSDHFQARRAHSDHVQFLGEAGFPGFALWITFLLLLVGGTARHYWRTGRRSSLFLAAQLVAFAAAMATDYLLELPYGKFQFFLVVFLALAATDDHRDAGESRRCLSKVLVTAVALFAVLQIGYHVRLARKVHLAASIEKAYLRSAASAEILVLGRDFARLGGHTKSFFRTYLLLAHTAHLLGQDAVADAAAREALELHPYHPNTLRLLAVLADDPEDSRKWREAYVYVMEEATVGYEREYPARPD